MYFICYIRILYEYICALVIFSYIFTNISLQLTTSIITIAIISSNYCKFHTLKKYIYVANGRSRWFIQFGGRFTGGPDDCHRGCAYIMLQTVQWSRVYNTLRSTVCALYTIKAMRNNRACHIVSISGFILSRYCYNVQKATYNSITLLSGATHNF